MMRKMCHMLKFIWKSMGMSFLMILLLIMISSLCINYCCIIPIDRAQYYIRYANAGMDNGAILNMNFVLHEKWSQALMTIEDAPEYHEVAQIVDSFAQRALSICKQATTDNGYRMSLYVYNDVLADHLSLDAGITDMLKEVRQRADGIGVIIDERLKSVYKKGDTLTGFRIHGTDAAVNAYVAGYIDLNAEFIYSTASGSVPSITHIISRNAGDGYVALTVSSDLLETVPEDYVYSTLLLFPKGGEKIDDVIDEWRKVLKESGLGNIMTFNEMQWNDITMSLMGSDNVLGLLSLWSVLLLLVGLRGFIASLSGKLMQQLAVYRLIGMRMSTWILLLTAAYCMPIIAAVVIPLSFIAYIFQPMVKPMSIAILLLMGVVLSCSLVVPMLLDTMHSLRNNQLNIAYAERNI